MYCTTECSGIIQVTKCIDDVQERQKISEGSYVKGSYFKVYANPSVFNGQPILNSLLESEGLEGMGHQLGGYQLGRNICLEGGAEEAFERPSHFSP